MNRLELDGQVCIVTGGARGIGAAIVRRMLDSGAKVAIWDNGDEESPSGALNLRADVTDYASLEAALAQTESQLGPVAALVNSAGIAGLNAPIDEYSLEEWDRVIAINLTGTFLVNRVVVPGMRARNYGRIVNIASVAGKEGNPNAGPYSASKAGVIGLTKALGKELAKYDIAVNAITPAAAQTRILEVLKPEFIEYMLSKIPRGRFVGLDEIAAMVCWLCTKENSFTTASVFDLSGGRATY